MFAVPGWNLSAPLATQVEKAKPKDQQGEGKKGKKRKRKQQVQVDEGNVGDFWEKLVGGKDKSRAEQTDAASRLQPHEDRTSEKQGKKRKRKGDTGHIEDGNEGHKASIAESSAKEPLGKREKKKHKKEHTGTSNNSTDLSKDTTLEALIPEPKGLTPLQKSMRAKLTSARFRHLNESLYTKPSVESLSLFSENPEMFEDYHRGFAQQVEVWPENPVDGYVQTIRTRGKIRTRDHGKDRRQKNKRGIKNVGAEEGEEEKKSSVKPLPRNLKGHCTIADLGCGTASLSYRLQSSLKHLHLTLHSFDLSKPTGPTASLVTVADISALPLPDGAADVAIFCLALMGTNWLDFIDEAWRVLRWRGELWVSEIKSRFGRVTKSKVPINSVGSKRKDKKDSKGKKGNGEVEEGIQGSEDEAELAERVDGVEGKEGTDVSAFVEALRKRGFILDALPERQNDAIDLSNKMFVKMQFIKAGQPFKGKNVKGAETEKGGKNLVALNPNSDDGDRADSKVLKPCLYKIR